MIADGTVERHVGIGLMLASGVPVARLSDTEPTSLRDIDGPSWGPYDGF
jgi:hypothetical protein